MCSCSYDTFGNTRSLLSSNLEQHIQISSTKRRLTDTTNSCCFLHAAPLAGHLNTLTLKTLQTPILLMSTIMVNVAHSVYNFRHMTSSESPPCALQHSFWVIRFVNRISARLSLSRFHPFIVTFLTTNVVTIC